MLIINSVLSFSLEGCCIPWATEADEQWHPRRHNSVNHLIIPRHHFLPESCRDLSLLPCACMYWHYLHRSSSSSSSTEYRHLTCFLIPRNHHRKPFVMLAFRFDVFIIIHLISTSDSWISPVSLCCLSSSSNTLNSFQHFPRMCFSFSRIVICDFPLTTQPRAHTHITHTSSARCHLLLIGDANILLG